MARPRKAPEAPQAAALELDILSIGAQGDGIAEHDGRRLFVPCTTAGDRVRARPVGKDRAVVVD